MKNKMIVALTAMLVIAIGFQIVLILQLDNRLKSIDQPVKQLDEVYIQTPKKMPYLRWA